MSSLTRDLDCSELSKHMHDRGCSHQPHTDSGQDRVLKTIKIVRSLTIKINPTKEQWTRLRELSYQAMHYKNCQMRAIWAEAFKLRIDPDTISLSVQSKHCDGGCWMQIPLADGVCKDKYQKPLLDLMINGKIKMAKAVVIFKPNRGKTLLRLTYNDEIMMPPMGVRVATLSNLNGRFLLRNENETIDYTSKLTTFIKRKQDWDKIRRRVSCQIGRRKGHARSKRKVFYNVHFDDWSKTHIHQWTASIVKWCVDHGIGKIMVLDLDGGDWPEYMFRQQLEYKCHERNIELTEANANEASTQRLTKHEVNKARRKSKKIGDAARTLNAALK